jgi:hypothetical protein
VGKTHRIWHTHRRARERTGGIATYIAVCATGLTTCGEWVVTAQAQMNSVSMKLGETLGMVKAVGTLEKSTELMTLVNELVKVRSRHRMPRAHCVCPPRAWRSS